MQNTPKINDKSVNSLKEMMVSEYCQNKFEEKGYIVTQCSDLSKISSILESLDKPYITPHLSPDRSVFNENNCFWLLVKKDDVFVAASGFTLENIGQENVFSYWDRLYKHETSKGLKSVANPLLKDLKGKLVYMGDLHIKEGHRGFRSLLQYAALISHIFISTRWSPDWTYAFLHKKHVMRGAAALYGFTRTIPESKIWDRIEEPRRNDEFCCMLSNDDYLHLIETFQVNDNETRAC